MASTDPEINRKRKMNGQDFPISRKYPSPRERELLDNVDNVAENDSFLTLSLSSFHHRFPSAPAPTPPPAPPSAPHPPGPGLSLQLSPNPPSFIKIPNDVVNVPKPIIPSPSSGPARPTRARRNPSQSPREGKSATVPPPFPWATNRRATVHSLEYLIANKITTISGDVQCKRCEKSYPIEFNLEDKFREVGSYVARNKALMHDRAPGTWMNPPLPKCKFCDQENSLKPLIAEKKKSINWLFLLLGQMLGCCTLDQLKYFCKHTKNHRTGAKDRVLYLTYLSLCKQLKPDGPFDR